METKITLYITILLLLCITVAYGGDRRNIEVYDGGKKTEAGDILYEHHTLLDPGECDEHGCVVFEDEVEAWDGNNWIHQYIDINGDGGCNIIKVWKPLSDPTWGMYYKLHATELCKGTR